MVFNCMDSCSLPFSLLKNIKHLAIYVASLKVCNVVIQATQLYIYTQNDVK